MHTAKPATLLVVLAVFVGVLGAENVTVDGPFIKTGPYGDHYGAFSLCGAGSLFGGNRPEESLLNSVYRVPMNSTAIGVLLHNSLPRNRNVTGNVALLLGFRVYTLMEVTDAIASNQVWSFDATNCSYSPQAGDTRWTFYNNFNGGDVFPADVREFGGAIIDQRYLVWGGGQRSNSNVTHAVLVVDSSTDEVLAANLSVARSGVAAVTANDGTAWFGGGVDRVNRAVFDTIDIINSSLQVNSEYRLSEARGHLAGASMKDLVVFGGGLSGFTDTANGTVEVSYSKTVDIFNLATNQHTTHQLSEARGMLTATATKDFIVFAGGITRSVFNATTGALIEESNSRRVDIYYLADGTWFTTNMSEARAYLSSTAVDNNVLISSGSFFNGLEDAVAYTKSIDIFRIALPSPSPSPSLSPSPSPSAAIHPSSSESVGKASSWLDFFTSPLFAIC